MANIQKRDDLIVCTYDSTDPYSASVKIYGSKKTDRMVELVFNRPQEKNTEVTVNRDEIMVYGPRDMVYDIACCLSELLREGLL